MKISDLIKRLETIKSTQGDIEVRILDDESGEMEPVAAAFNYKANGNHWVDLCTLGQTESDSRDW